MATKTTKSENAGKPLPTSLSELIALSKSLGIKYEFQKKPELIRLIQEAQKAAGIEVSDAPKVDEKQANDEKSEPAKKTPVKKAPVKKEVEEKEEEEDVEIPEPKEEKPEVKKAEVNRKAPAKMYKELKYFKDTANFFRNAAKQTQNDKDNAAQYDKYAEEAQAKIDEYEKKKVKKGADYSDELNKAFDILNINKEDAKSKRAVKITSTSDEDIELIKERADVKEIMDNDKYTKSDKARKLYQKCGLKIGDISKVVNIHYSFAYCVVDTFRKQHISEKEGASKKKK